MNYALHFIIYLGIYSIMAMSLNLVVGYCGLLTLANAAFFAVGAYSYALLSQQAHWGFIPCLLFGAMLSGFLSLGLSLSAWRLRGDQFVLCSLGFQVIVANLLRNWSSPNAPLGSFKNLTNGPTGVASIPSPSLLGFQFSTPSSYAILTIVTSFFCIIILSTLKNSPWGRLLICMRDDELATRGLGKNTRLAKVQAIAISAAFSAIAGILYAGHVHYIDPTAASLDDSILVLSMVIVGGAGNIRGPLIGALILTAMPEALRYVNLPESQAGNIRLGVYGLLLLILMHFRPQGIAGTRRTL